MNGQKILSIVFLASLLIISRFFPHPANFTPFLALSMYIGYRFRDSSLSFVVPLAAIFISDLVLGFYEGWVFVYLGFAIAGIIGSGIRPTTISIASRSAASSVIFFLVSNFGVWYSTPLYAKTFAGLNQCYVAALPFLNRSLTSTLFYSALIFSLSFIVLRAFQSRLAQK